ncbi:MAG: DUF4301 family protein [Bacteroidales bacterium]|nr:DUF4301 family protein [Bacteroidales bacterium]
MFTEKDLAEISGKGMDIATIRRQIDHFKTGFPFAGLVRPATVNDGIIEFSREEEDRYEEIFNQAARQHEIVKFVPASGAASRMFSHLFTFLQQNNTVRDFQKERNTQSVSDFYQRIRDFAFFGDLAKVMNRDGLDIESHIRSGEPRTMIEYLLTSTGLNYGNLPKGLIKFHSYPGQSRTSMEEHLVEAAQYAISADGRARVHFTVSPEHMGLFREKANQAMEYLEKELRVSFDITFSVQSPSTDTIAVEMDNTPFREEDGTLVFRPGGHGALLKNLGEIGGDIIFIKNIDNVVPDRLKPETRRYKKILGGLLLYLRKQIFGYIRELREGNPTQESLERTVQFATGQMNISLPDDFLHLDIREQRAILLDRLDRPIRICGMVRNEGEPGGGPFWVRSSTGEITPQIVESSQINLKDPVQAGIVKRSTHFNPVDLVCGIRDHQGRPFDLERFIDSDTGFISIKSKNGRSLKALELPGLWNGAMAGWITVFVEVPIITFNPVKTVNDLLRPQHQP